VCAIGRGEPSSGADVAGAATRMPAHHRRCARASPSSAAPPRAAHNAPRQVGSLQHIPQPCRGHGSLSRGASCCRASRA
jgi:hypothetical protein